MKKKKSREEVKAYEWKELEVVHIYIHMVALRLLQKGKKNKSIGIRYEYRMSVRTFVHSRVSEHDLSISRKHTHVSEGYDDTE